MCNIHRNHPLRTHTSKSVCLWLPKILTWNRHKWNSVGIFGVSCCDAEWSAVQRHVRARSGVMTHNFLYSPVFCWRRIYMLNTSQTFSITSVRCMALAFLFHIWCFLWQQEIWFVNYLYTSICSLWKVWHIVLCPCKSLYLCVNGQWKLSKQMRYISISCLCWINVISNFWRWNFWWTHKTRDATRTFNNHS